MIVISHGLKKYFIWIHTAVASGTFKCPITYAKRSFYHLANAIFGKVGRLASEEVIIEIVKIKCLPILLPRDAMLARYMLSSCVRPSVWLFVVSRSSTKMAKIRMMQTTPYERLVYWRQRYWRNSNGVTPNGVPNSGRVGYNWQLLTNISFSETV